MKLHAISLGCQMSAADNAEMAAPLRARGFSNAEGLDDADAVLISTCTVRQHAEDRALSLIGTLREWKAQRPERLLIVAGCAAERLKDWLQKRFDYIDLVVGAKSIEQFPQLIEEALKGRFELAAEDDMALAPQAAVSSYVTIMRGCNYSCSYCIVPAVRGRELYRPTEDILRDIRIKVEGGAREIMLLGQTVNSYRQTHEGRPVDFPDLLRLVDKVDGLKRVRFMSPHPHYLSERMIAAMAECPTVCEALHIPVQSGSDRLLKMMRRNYTRDEFLGRISRLRSAVKGVVISTDIIVGFPTEREEEFIASLSLLKEMGASSAYCFKYSPRESTESAAWPDDVPQTQKEERLKRLNGLVDELSQEALRRQIGGTVEVLTDEDNFGRTRSGFKVKVSSAAGAGRLVNVAITGATRLTLLGNLVPEHMQQTAIAGGTL